MTELLSLDDYQSLAATINIPAAAFIDGSFKNCHGSALTIRNPATDTVLTQIATATDADVDFAAQKAREAFDSGQFLAMGPAQRKEILIRLCKLMTRNRHELAVLESIDSGKPIQDCATIDVPEAINTIKWHAESIDKIYDRTAPASEDAIAMIVREPLGVVGCILPWNFPLLMLAWKIGPALAAGNAVIVKPAEQTSLTALRVAELATEAGLPRGILQILPGDGPTTGAAIGKNPLIDMVSFTGSTETGRHFLRYAADSNLKEVTLECGGKNPAIVLDDATNLDSVAEHICSGAFWNMGQNCSAISRLIVQQGIKDQLIDKITHFASHWRQGNPLDPANRLGVLVENAHYNKVASYINDATKRGITPIFGGKSDDNKGFGPVLFDNIPPDDALATEEIFGPILSIITAHSVDEALHLANQSAYGLTASIFSNSGKTALRAARHIKAGTVTVNCYGEGDNTTPFGGFKQSGFGGRDNGSDAHDQFTQTKTIWVDLTDDDPHQIA